MYHDNNDMYNDNNHIYNDNNNDSNNHNNVADIILISIIIFLFILWEIFNFYNEKTDGMMITMVVVCIDVVCTYVYVCVSVWFLQHSHQALLVTHTYIGI